MNYETPLMPDWMRLEPNVFETIVTAILRRLHPDGHRPDGSGGDGGRDFVALSPAGDIVYQVKRLDRLHPSAKRQIKESIAAVSASRPAKWILVAPIDPTPKEMAWFRLATADLGVPCEWFGRNWLDAECPRHLDLLLGHLGSVGSLRARVADELNDIGNRVVSVADIVRAQDRLISAANLVHPDFGVELTGGPNGSRVRLTPKSGQPLQIEIKTIEHYLGSQLADSIRFGIPVRFQAPGQLFGLPPELVGDGLMDWLVEGEQGPLTVVLLQVLDSKGRVTGELRFGPVQPNLGMGGAHFACADASGWLTMQLRLLEPGMGGAQLNLDLDPDPTLFPDDLLPLCTFVDAARKGTFLALGLRVDGTECHLERVMMPDFFGEMLPAPLAAYIEDLARLQRHSNTRRAISLEHSDNDPNIIRDLIRGIDGEHLELHGTVTATLTHVTDNVIQMFQDGCAVVIDQHLESFELQGERYPLNLARRVTCGRVVIEDLAALHRARESGEECDVQLSPAAAGYWTVMLGDSDDDESTN
ncbi:MAG: hypothetical protein ABMA25_10940 [Ilumatobacteraceae bacterium]